ncbi:MAG: heme-binding beta-barrel domain-containing protein [Devosia sp.]
MKASLGAFTICVMAQFLGPVVLPASAGETELAVLTSYVGSWQGEGALEGGDQPEPFRCRMSIAKGNMEKVTYTGRCSLISANLSISGTIAFNDTQNQYEAAMSSNAGFTGIAIGQLQGEKITFDLREKRTDSSGSDVRIGSQILLVNGIITVNFQVEFNDSGDVLEASVPFAR